MFDDDRDMYDIDGDGNLDSNEQCWYEEDLYGSDDDGGSSYSSGSKYSSGRSTSSKSTSDNSTRYVQNSRQAGVGELIICLIIWAIIAFLFVGGIIMMVALPPLGAFMIFLGVKLKEAVF